MINNESLADALIRMESMDNWQSFVEDAWIRMSQAGKTYFNEDGSLPKDWLITSKDQQPFFGWWGWIAYPDPELKDSYEFIENKNINFIEADHPGLARWGSTDWAWTRSEELRSYQNKVSPITALITASLISCFEEININFSDLNSVVHWGPGCGNYTLIMRHLGARHTEYLIDIPLVSIMQYEFLSKSFEEFGYGEINFITCEEDKIVEGIPNIVPLPFIHKVPQDHDLFMAFHSLNESSVDSQKYVIEKKNWFNSDICLLSWTENLMENIDYVLYPWGSGSDNWKNIVDDLIERGRLKACGSDKNDFYYMRKK